MTARFSTAMSASHCTSAAACSSAHLAIIMDTALLLAVSISIFLLPLRILG